MRNWKHFWWALAVWVPQVCPASSRLPSASVSVFASPSSSKWLRPPLSTQCLGDPSRQDSHLSVARPDSFPGVRTSHSLLHVSSWMPKKHLDLNQNQTLNFSPTLDPPRGLPSRHSPHCVNQPTPQYHPWFSASTQVQRVSKSLKICVGLNSLPINFNLFQAIGI